jgi:hypothetical protein
MTLYLKNTDDAEAVITGGDHAAVSEPRKRQIADHYRLLPAANRQAALEIDLTGMDEDEEAFALDLFTETPPEGEDEPPPSYLPESAVFVADLTALRALEVTTLAIGAVRGATLDGQLGFWRLIVGSAADNPPGIVRPNGWSSGNQRIWQKQL